MRFYGKINAVILMKTKKTYIQILMLFGVVILLTMLFQYKHFKFQFYNVNEYHEFSYFANEEHLQVDDYFATIGHDYGGATVYLDSQEPQLQAEVTLQSGKVLYHVLTYSQDGYYVMDVVDSDKDRSAPVKIVVRNQENQLLEQAEMKYQVDELYQASSYDYSFLNIFMNQSGIFVGRFEAYDEAKLTENYSTATLEFCHPDDSKSSGYALLARAQMPLQEFLSENHIGYLPFLNVADYDENIPVDVVITFEGEGQKTIVMNLEKGVS